MRRVLGFLAALAATAMATPAMAGTIVLTDGGSNAQISKSFSNAELEVKATAFSINSSNVIKTSQLASWGDGLGITNPGYNDSHTIDNSGNGWKDFVLLQFNQAVTLNDATFRTGWHSMYDTDATIGHLSVNWSDYAVSWDVDLTGVFHNQNKSVLDQFGLQTSESEGFYSESRNINPGLSTGNVWLISSAMINSDGFKDGFKLKQFTYTIPTYTPPVPEPSTWAMLILGMGLVGGAMRRRNRGRLALA